MFHRNDCFHFSIVMQKIRKVTAIGLTHKESQCFHSASRSLHRCTLVLYKQILMAKSWPVRKWTDIPFSRWLRICSRMAAKLLNSGEVSSIVSKQERSIRVLTENLEQKYGTITIYMNISVLYSRAVVCINQKSMEPEFTLMISRFSQSNRNT